RLHIFQQVAWGIRTNGKLSQRTDMREMVVAHAKVAQDCHLPARRNRQNFRSREAKITRLSRIWRADEDALRPALPCCAVNRRTWVRRKPGREEGTATKTQLTKNRHRSGRASLSRDKRHEGDCNQRNQGRTSDKRGVHPFSSR